MGNWRLCPKCKKTSLFYANEDGDYSCIACGYIQCINLPLPYVRNDKPQFEYQENGSCSGYISFAEVASRLGKSERALRYRIACSSYPVLFPSIKQGTRSLYRQDVVDLVAKTGFYIRYIDGRLIIKASEAAKIMDVTAKTAINGINHQRISGWCSGGHYDADAQNVLDQVDLHKPVSSGRLQRGALELFQKIRELKPVDTSHVSNR